MKSKNFSARIDRYGRVDFPLFAVTSGLLLFGILMVYSASSYNAEINYGNEFFFVYKQVFGVIAGIAVMLVMTFFDYRKLIKARYIALGVSILLLVLVLIPGIGVENYGARRWLNLGFITLQASEVAKLGYVIFASAYTSKNYKKMTTIRGILPLIAVGGIICILTLLEPSMSVTMCIAFVIIAMLVIGGMRFRHLICMILPLALAVILLIIIEPYRMNRLMAFLDPWASPLEEGYQLLQSFYAIGSGGFFGVGLFNSRQKFLFLPFAESDFIFSVIGEELGLLGCLCVILAFCFMIYRLVTIARQASDRFGCYLASGMAVLVGVQVLINIAVVTGSIPPTGIPLPFVSSGSSAIIVFCAGIGISESVRLRSHASVRALL
ncbi:MAG: putative lipid II flippase FtsW [Clostridia bacterium]|nr:putative lipid II flippase FtsW [Clostridia bacterium]